MGCSFLFTTPSADSIRIAMPLLGAHNVQNMVLAAAVAHVKGIRLETIALAAKMMKPIEHRLELKQQNGVIIIDDAFNSNPVGAKNAVDILSRFATGRRFLITPGMVELGDMEYAENLEFGKEIGAKNLEYVLFVGKKRSEPLVKGYQLAGGNPENLHVVSTLFEANEFIRPLLQPGDVVLYENDLPDSYNE
jgi:UDP-N-acetylmuramoyl-tripeptide--D-alanyl-D-alanine ligase